MTIKWRLHLFDLMPLEVIGETDTEILFRNAVAGVDKEPKSPQVKFYDSQLLARTALNIKLEAAINHNRKKIAELIYD